MGTVDGVPVYLLGNDQVGDASVKVLEDRVGSNHQTLDRKGSDLNGIVIPKNSATVNPNLGYVYEL